MSSIHYSPELKAALDRIYAKYGPNLAEFFRDVDKQLAEERAKKASDRPKTATEEISAIREENAQWKRVSASLVETHTSLINTVCAKDAEITRLKEQEKQACEYLVNLTGGQIGCGETPISNLIASHAGISADRMELRAEITRLREALKKARTDDWGPSGGRVVMGNEGLGGDAGEFYKGFNAGIRAQFEKTCKIARAALAPQGQEGPEQASGESDGEKEREC